MLQTKNLSRKVFRFDEFEARKLPDNDLHTYKSLYAHYLYKIGPIKGVNFPKKLNKIN